MTHKRILFWKKTDTIGYNIVKNLDYHKLNLEKDGSNEHFRKYFVECILN